MGDAPQISKPELGITPSLEKKMVEPAATCTPSGPEVPQYLTPFTETQSQEQLGFCSTLNAVTDSVTCACAVTVMVHCWLLP